MIRERFLFRDIKEEETAQAVEIEKICFPPHEACSEQSLTVRIQTAPEFFLAAIDRKTGKLAGFFNGVATDEEAFRDEFFTDIRLHDPNGKHVMLLGLDVLPQYRNQGLGKKLVCEYIRREREKNRKRLFLTCLDSKVGMYEKWGFVDHGIANSTWGGEEWHEMSIPLG